MSEIITEISIYLVLAILLGYTFGWLITKALSKEKIKEDTHSINEHELNTLNQERLQYQTKNSELLSENNKILLENREQKLKIHYLLKKLQERDLLIKSKNNALEEFKVKLLKQAKEDELEIMQNVPSKN